jgi:ABC-type sulfate transport system permease subunit
MNSVVAYIYNLWQQIPAGVRAGLTLLVVAVFSTALSFGWKLPTDWANAQEQVAAFWLVLVPVVVAVWQKSIWPPLFAWILTLLGLQPVFGHRLTLVKAA